MRHDATRPRTEVRGRCVSRNSRGCEATSRAAVVLRRLVASQRARATTVCHTRLPARRAPGYDAFIPSAARRVVMRWLVFALLSALLAFPLHSRSADPPPKDAPRGVDELVADLGSPVFGVREQAQRDLWARGEEAVPALERAA